MPITPHHACCSITSAQASSHLFRHINDSSAAQTTLQPHRRLLSRTNTLMPHQPHHITTQGCRSSTHHRLRSGSMPTACLNTASDHSASVGCHGAQLVLSSSHRLLLAAAPKYGPNHASFVRVVCTYRVAFDCGADESVRLTCSSRVMIRSPTQLSDVYFIITYHWHQLSYVFNELHALSLSSYQLFAITTLYYLFHAMRSLIVIQSQASLFYICIMD